MIFVDTSFFFAASVSSDFEHDAALRVLASLDRPNLVTTNNVRGETWTLLRRRSGHHRAVQFLDLLQRSQSIQVIEISSDLEQDAWAWLRRHDERVYSFVDATSFAFMRENRITEALAFDGDFAAAGFVELRV